MPKSVGISLALALASLAALAADAPVTSYPPLQSYHEYALEHFAAFRRPESRTVSTCTLDWVVTAPDKIPAKLVEAGSIPIADFWHRI